MAQIDANNSSIMKKDNFYEKVKIFLLIIDLIKLNTKYLNRTLIRLNWNCNSKNANVISLLRTLKSQNSKKMILFNFKISLYEIEIKI